MSKGAWRFPAPLFTSNIYAGHAEYVEYKIVAAEA